jgi:transcriptional regulator with XRE-family HTH domain
VPDARIIITAAQCRAARALLEWSQAQLAEAAAVEREVVELLEARFRRPSAVGQQRIRKALEDGGVVFIADDDGGGLGARLKFSRKEVRAINRWEGEGGTAGEDDVW